MLSRLATLLDQRPALAASGTALEAAAMAGHVETFAILVKRGADVNRESEWKPLTMAALAGHADLVRFLALHRNL